MNYQDVIKEVNEVLTSYSNALTLRQIYYRLVSAEVIENTRSNYNQLSKQLVKARELGEVDENRIVDRSRYVIDIAFDSPLDFIQACLDTINRRYVRRFWDTQALYCEAWVEKDALSQVLADAVYPLNTIIAPSRGYSSYTYLRKEAGTRVLLYAESKPMRILYFGDHDPSGLQMRDDLQNRLDRYCGIGKVVVEPIALTIEQVRAYGLPPNPVKRADTRSQKYRAMYGQSCWELDALEPSMLIALCRDAVASRIDNKEAWDAVAVQDKREREVLAGYIGNIQKNIEKGIDKYSP